MSKKSAIATGLLLATLSIIVHQYLHQSQRMELLASIMVLIGSVYFGFAFKEERKITRFIEVSVAAGFVILSLLGLWISPWVLCCALLLHGVWDLLHHNSDILAEIPRWYLPFCATYDWIMAAYVFYLIF